MCFLLFQNGTNTLGVGGTAQYTLHQAKGDASLGSTRQGYLSKRSEGRLRNVWQKRRCQVLLEGFLDIYHADESKSPTRVNLLTCQMKNVAEDRTCFDVVSYNRTYHFQAEGEADKEEWMSVLLNSKDGAMAQAFREVDGGKTGGVGGGGGDGVGGGGGGGGAAAQGFLELQRTLVAFIRTLPGNDKCCDCGSNNGE